MKTDRETEETLSDRGNTVEVSEGGKHEKRRQRRQVG